MSCYRRAATSNASFFFTDVTYRRQPILCDEVIRNALRAALETVLATRPFVIEVWVLLPDHLNCIWTLPEGDADFSTCWMMIKRGVAGMQGKPSSRRLDNCVKAQPETTSQQ
jgi:putative transposase